MYRGKVTQVDSSGVWVTTADYGLLGPCQAVVANYAPGDMVLCVNVGDEVAPDLVVVGRLTTKGNVTTGATTDNAIARFDGTAGALQNSGVTIDDDGVISTAGLEFGANGPRMMVGTGSAEGAVSAPVSSEWKRTDGQTQVKETGTGSTGWVIPSPTGAVTAFAGATAPQGWLLCYGQAVSRTTYANLFAVIGTTYGTGDGSTTFSLPDLRGRTVAGLDNMGGTDASRLDWANTRGTAGGAQTHTLTTTEMPSHDHPLSLASSAGGDGSGVAWSSTSTTNSAAMQNTGGGGAHNNMQPTMLLNWIIRT